MRAPRLVLVPRRSVSGNVSEATRLRRHNQSRNAADAPTHPRRTGGTCHPLKLPHRRPPCRPRARTFSKISHLRHTRRSPMTCPPCSTHRSSPTKATRREADQATAPLFSRARLARLTTTIRNCVCGKAPEKSPITNIRPRKSAKPGKKNPKWPTASGRLFLISPPSLHHHDRNRRQHRRRQVSRPPSDRHRLLLMGGAHVPRVSGPTMSWKSKHRRRPCTSLQKSLRRQPTREPVRPPCARPRNPEQV